MSGLLYNFWLWVTISVSPLLGHTINGVDQCWQSMMLILSFSLICSKWNYMMVPTNSNSYFSFLVFFFPKKIYISNCIWKIRQMKPFLVHKTPVSPSLVVKSFTLQASISSISDNNFTQIIHTLYTATATQLHIPELGISNGQNARDF